MAGYEVARLDEIEEITDGREPWRPVRHHFGITSFGVNAWTAPRGGRPDHQRARRGRRRERGALPRPAGPRRASSSTASAWTHPPARSSSPAQGQADRLRRGARHDARRARRHPGAGVRAGRLGALGPAHAALPRRASTPSSADRGRARSSPHPAVRDVVYNLACCESLAGRTNDAIEHLRQRDRAAGAVPRVRAGRLGLRPDPRRAGLPGARRPSRSLSSAAMAPVGPGRGAPQRR